MNKNLIELEGLLRKIRPGLLSSLNPGIGDVNEYKTKLLNLSINPPESFFQLFQWKNGTKFSEEKQLGELYLMPLGLFLSLEDSVKINNEIKHWNNSFFPICSSEVGDFLLLNCNHDSEKFGSITNYSFHDFPTNQQKYDSIDSMINTLIKCYSQNIYYLDSNGLLDYDDEKEFEISAKLNPNSDYWE